MTGNTDLNEVKLLRTILQHCAGTVFVTDGQGNIIYANEEASAALGCTTEALLNMTIYELEEAGLTSSAVSIQVIQKRQTVTSRVYYTGNRENIVTGDPVFDDAGNLIMVVVYGQSRKAISERVKFLEEDNIVAHQALSYVMEGANGETSLVAESPATRACLAMAAKAAGLDSTIMLYGESGTGKEVFAHFIHRNSPRAQKLFLPVNCAAIPHELMESEFFGYEKGAFTGSSKEGKMGLFELADGGTLFLDELGELDLSMQSKLLRVLESGEMKRVGGTAIRQVNVRIVAATNRNLPAMVADGSFREDLYYRLSVIPISIPPLRQRREDIAVFAVMFLERLNKKYSSKKHFAPSALDTLQAYHWPGNVRELRNVIERLFVIISDDVISQCHVSRVLGIHEPGLTPQDQLAAPLLSEEGSSLAQATSRFQRAYIAQVLQSCGGNVTLAAEKLGLGRSSLYKKLDKLSLSPRS